jgi:hypothetical protein
MFIIPITKSWLVSKTADRVYFACAIASLILFGIELGLLSAVSALDRDALDQSSIVLLVFYRVIQISIPGTALLWVGMWLHWIKFNIAKRGFWVIGLMTGPIGTVLYYFLVYRRQTREMLSETVLVTTPVAVNP